MRGFAVPPLHFDLKGLGRKWAYATSKAYDVLAKRNGDHRRWRWERRRVLARARYINHEYHSVHDFTPRAQIVDEIFDCIAAIVGVEPRLVWGEVK